MEMYVLKKFKGLTRFEVSIFKIKTLGLNHEFEGNDDGI